MGMRQDERSGDSAVRQAGNFLLGHGNAFWAKNDGQQRDR